MSHVISFFLASFNRHLYLVFISVVVVSRTSYGYSLSGAEKTNADEVLKTNKIGNLQSLLSQKTTSLLQSPKGVDGQTRLPKKIASKNSVSYAQDLYFLKFRSSKVPFSDVQSFFDASPMTPIHRYGFSPVYLVSSAKRIDLDLRLLASTSVEYIERVPEFKSHGAGSLGRILPNDREFSKLWSANPLTESNRSISLPRAWAFETGLAPVKVCVIDSGVDYLHPDLRDNIWENPGEVGLDENGKDKRTNGLDDDQNGYIDDVRGWDFANDDNDPMDDDSHGTHVAGTIGAKGNNREGIAGVAWNVSLIPLKFLREDGSGTFADAIEAVEYCVSTGALISNNSYGSTARSETLDALMSWLDGKNHLFVTSAGNTASDNDIVANYPSSYPYDYILSVAASTKKGSKDGFSNYGHLSVDLAAPGERIYSSVPGRAYDYFSGTSMAAPHVAGAAALLIANWKRTAPNKPFTVLDVRTQILATVRKNSVFKPLVKSGGILDVFNLLEPDTSVPSSPQLLSAKKESSVSARLTFTGSGDDGSKGRASYYAFYMRDEKTNKTSQLHVLTPIKMNDEDNLEVVLGGFFQNHSLNEDLRANVYAVAFDNKNQSSKMSQALPLSLNALTLAQSLSNESLREISYEDPWQLTRGDIEILLEDSPGRPYKNGFSTSVKLPRWEVTKNSVLELRLDHDLEKNYDFLLIESVFGTSENVVILDKISGTRKEARYLIDLGPFILQNNQAVFSAISLKMKTDVSVTADGVAIRAVNLHTLY